MKWITRERPKIDRVACPWLIARFIDESPEFLFVPSDQVIAQAAATGAIPYDVPGVELTHDGPLCSFDAILKKYALTDPNLLDLAVIVRGADTARPDLAPQCHGLLAISLGLSHNFSDDHEQLKHGFVMYDALYSWLSHVRAEKHDWNPQRIPQTYVSACCTVARKLHCDSRSRSNGALHRDGSAVRTHNGLTNRQAQSRADNIGAS